MSTISPQGSRAGADVAPWTGTAAGSLRGPDTQVALQEGRFPAVALVPNRGLLEESVNFRQGRLIPKVSGGLGAILCA